MDLWNWPVVRALVDAVGGCVIALDSDGVVSGIRCATLELPLAGADAEGRRIDELLPAEVALSLDTALSTLERTQLPQTVTFELTGTGRRRHYSARLVLLEAEARQETGVAHLVVVRDITGQALVQQASLENELAYQLLAENATDVVAVEDREGTYIYVSPGVERLLGYSPREVMGRNRREFICEEHLEALRQRYPDPTLYPPEAGDEFMFRLRHKDGHWVWAESRVRTIEWQGRQALLSTVRDVHQRKLAEDRAAAVRQELEESRQRAEAANRAKSEFLASISHDLRTPLHGLLGMAELLEQTHLTPEQQEYLAAIQDSGDALLSRLNDLLDLSKIEAGRLDLEETEFDLVEAVEGLSDMLGSQAAAKGLQLFCHVPPDVPPVVRGDPQRLRQVLTNLIGNAIKFTKEGEVDVRVEVGEDDKLRFSVRDTGVGISRDRLDVLLGADALERPFRRGRRREGAGLGLTIARQLIALMGGELQVRSKEGEGTTFSFDLPLPASDREVRDVEGAQLKGYRLLASDENATNRQLMREILEQAGAEVDLTSGGVEAIRNLIDDPGYDCVILNAHLPDLDGLSTVSMIRSNRTLERLPVVVLVSSGDRAEVERCNQLHVNAILTKPVRRNVLLRAVEEVVSSGGFRDQGADVGPKGTVLVVEDNELNLRLARNILRRAGYGVVSARDGNEALRQLGKHAVDAVLMDIQLPDMDGIEATQRIRTTPAWSALPIIAMTAHAMKGDAEQFVAAGVDSCLAKPVNQADLLQVLSQEISRRRDQGPAAPQ